MDAFRGLTIGAMVLVNNPGSPDAVFAQLRHAPWHGWTIADLVFPFFLFIVGISLVFSYERRLAEGSSRVTLVRHVAIRSFVLLAIGLILNGAFYLPWEQLRIPGVLQRIGIVYLIASLVTITTTARERAVLAAALLLGYWGLMMWTPVPGHGAGGLGPAGNLASYADRHLLRGHLWRTTWDPEGVLSTLPAIATTLLGTLAAAWLRRTPVLGSDSTVQRSSFHSIVTNGSFRLIAAGVVATVIGWGWGRVFPINKNLWTSSFALFTAGLALLIFGGCYWLVDERRCRRWARPLLVLGVNPLAIFAASEIVAMGALPGARQLLYKGWLAPSLGPQLGSLAWAMAYLTVWWLVSSLMYRHKIFIKL